MNKNLRILLFCDVGLICALILFVWIDSALSRFASTFSQFGLLGAIILSARLSKKYGASLDADQKKKRFVVSAAGFVLIVGLVLYWAIRSNNALAWTGSSLTLLVLGTVFYAQWDQLNDGLNGSNQGESREANQSAQPTRLPGG